METREVGRERKDRMITHHCSVFSLAPVDPVSFRQGLDEARDRSVQAQSKFVNNSHVFASTSSMQWVGESAFEGDLRDGEEERLDGGSQKFERSRSVDAREGCAKASGSL
jgi:hypothetical protein